MTRRTGAWSAALFFSLIAATSGPDALAGGLPGLDASPSPSASPSAGGRPTSQGQAANATFGLGPATKGKIDRRNNFTYLQSRGAVVKDEVAVVNLGTTPLTLNIYAADALNDGDGTLGLQPGRVKPTESASWVTVTTPNQKGFVVVPPRTAAGPSTVIVPFTMRIPTNAEVGDHLAGIVASLVTQGQTAGDRTANVKFEQRIAVRLATRVAGELSAKLELDSVSASYVGTLNPAGRGTATVTYTVRNAGNVRLGGKPSLNVHGLFGPSFSPEELPEVPLLLPGNSATVTVEVPDVLPLISLTADVSVVALAAVGDANPASETATASTRLWAVPWTLLALILLVTTLVGLWWRRRRSTVSGSAGGIDTSTGVDRPRQPVVAAAAAPHSHQEH